MSDVLKILVCPPNEGGCAYYRAINPYRKLAELYPDDVEIKFNKNPLGVYAEGEKAGKWIEDWEFEDMHWADIVMTNNISNFGGNYTARIVGKAKEFEKFVHFDTDDLLTDLYSGHRLEQVYKEKGLSDITKFVYNHADLVTVTQEKFAERIKPWVGGVLAVIKNSIDYDLPCWNFPRQAGHNKVCRIGWAGGIHHEEDVKEFSGVPNWVNQRVGRERVWWDFYGRPPTPSEDSEREKNQWQQDVWDNYEKILMKGFRGGKNWSVHPALPADRYGMFYSFMDLAIAPLQMNDFNDSKSEIKVAECGRYRVPLIASDVGCYSETIVNWETGVLLPPDAGKSEWIKVLVKLIKNKKLRERMGRNLHEVTEKYFNLNETVGNRLQLYEECFNLIKKKDEKEKAKPEKATTP